MASLLSKNTGQKLLRQTKLLNGTGKENLKILSQKEKEKAIRNLPVTRDNSQKP